jgi:hypothetical protein
MDIVLTVLAWRRGWKAWALLPIGIAFFIALVISGSSNLGTSGIFLYLLIALAELGTLGYMVAKPRRVSQPHFESSNSPAKAGAVSTPVDEPAKLLPATVACSTATAKLVLPDGSEIRIDDAVKPIGRDDFDKVVSPEDLKYISRHHMVIRAEDGKYFVEDLNSANGTKANGIDISGKGIEAFKNGDRIAVADVVALTFQV